MASIAPNQMTFSFEPSLPERFPTLRAYVAYRAAVQQKSMKVIAADMDISPSTLTRKLNPNESDTQRFNVDDLEGYLESTGDTPAIIEYLAAKYMDTPEARRTRVLTQVEAIVPELAMLLASLKTSA